MKIDPDSCKVNLKENLMWAIIHDLIAHPLLALSLYRIKVFINFHDYTSRKAWRR